MTVFEHFPRENRSRKARIDPQIFDIKASLYGL